MLIVTVIGTTRWRYSSRRRWNHLLLDYHTIIINLLLLLQLISSFICVLLLNWMISLGFLRFTYLFFISSTQSWILLVNWIARFSCCWRLFQDNWIIIFSCTMAGSISIIISLFANITIMRRYELSIWITSPSRSSLILLLC